MTPEEGREAHQDYKKHIGTSAFLEDRQTAREYFKQLAADQGGLYKAVLDHEQELRGSVDEPDTIK
eukprot:12417384-Karenia_brevis.AAC.1